MLYELKEDRIVPAGSSAERCFCRWRCNSAWTALLTIYAERRGPLTASSRRRDTTHEKRGAALVSSGPALSSSIALRSKVD
jgi:hypothetical protein